jgi:outer membrane protein OmpA-like peptidoglycan-associated protein
MVVRDYLVKNFKVKDTPIKTIGLGKSDTVADGGSVEILVYPEGTRHSANSRFNPAEVCA